MKGPMQIETYEIEEIKGECGTMAADAESIELIGKLGLEGQQSLSNPDTLTRFPYPRMTKTQAVVFGALFPAKANVKNFKHGIIPLRVLQVIAFCKEMPQTQHMEVWHSHVPADDPVLVGGPHEYGSEHYLLARWGESLLPFEKLVEKAIPLVRASMMAHLAKTIGRLKTYCDGIDDLVRVYVETGERPTWNVYD